MLSDSLGIKGSLAENKFLSDILVVVSSVSKQMSSVTQEVVQADGAHSLFGKYTLFSAYMTMAHGKLSNVAFGILFQNKYIKNWLLLWDFVGRIHPNINCLQVMLLMNQDKGINNIGC